MTNHSQIEELLIRDGLVNSEGFGRAKAAQGKSETSIGKTLAQMGLANEDAVSSAIAKELKLECLGLDLPDIPTELDFILPVKFCFHRLVIPLSMVGTTLRLAMTDPLDYSTIKDVVFRTGKQIIPVVATETTILKLLDRSHADAMQSQKTYELMTSFTPEGEVAEVKPELNIDVVKLAKDITLAPIVRLVNLILSGAAKAGASDIHIEPKEKYLQVRQRVDGILEEVFKIPKTLQDATISRLKIISKMDISDRRRSQDGRSELRFEGKRIDLRVSTLPTNFGEKVVIRLLDQRRAMIPMDQMDLTPENLKTLQTMLVRPQGLILVTGPTGSGKSSTLYTALNWLKSPKNNIVTVEDPIEYQLEGVNQVQINSKAGVTFAAGLRSILRQDPNIILIGEIRDKETANIALEAAQTGHLLLSTLHTNDAPATITRLINLEIEPFMVAASLIGVLAQRLVQRTCTFCAAPRDPAPELMAKLGGASQFPSDAKWLAGRGCEKCKLSGYLGRIAVHEFLQMTDELRELISSRAPEFELRKAARTSGMKTLAEDAIAKAVQGLTTLEAVLRVVAPDESKLMEEDEEAEITNEYPNPRRRKNDKSNHAVETPLNLAMPMAVADDGQPIRILIVEDDRTIISVVKYYLELEGFEVLVAKEGGEALKVAIKEQPGVIVTDKNMQGMSGVELIKKLRADDRTKHIGILMLTSDESLESETHSLAIGADDYIHKPVEPRRLAARIKALLARIKIRQSV